MLRAMYESCESGLSPTGVCGLSGSDMFAQPGKVTNRFSWKRNRLSENSEDHKPYLVGCDIVRLARISIRSLGGSRSARTFATVPSHTGILRCH